MIAWARHHQPAPDNRGLEDLGNRSVEIGTGILAEPGPPRRHWEGGVGIERGDHRKLPPIERIIPLRHPSGAGGVDDVRRVFRRSGVVQIRLAV